MRHKRKPAGEQVIVITGASSGIGLATAKLAAARGAKVVLSSRNERELSRIADQMRGEGADVAMCAADVADPGAMDRLARTAIERYGRIDTWVNDAGVGIYGKLLDVPLEEKRRLFETNFWGVVHGCRAAVAAMRADGGTIVNVGSSACDRAVPLQGIYSASKHTVKAYTDALRMELEMDRIPIAVTLVKPAAIDTPYLEHARSHLGVMPSHAPPVYDPMLVARTILACAEHPRRDALVGGSARVLALLERVIPRAADILLERTFEKPQRSELPTSHEEALDAPPTREGNVHGAYAGRVRKASAYTFFAMHPAVAASAAIGLGAIAVGAARRLL